MRRASLAVFLVFGLATACCGAVAQPQPLPFEAAVVEHVAFTGPDDVHNASAAATVMHRNLDVLDRHVAGLVATAQSQGKPPLDLVLFSEMALTSLTFKRTRMAHFLVDLRDEWYMRRNVCRAAPRPDAGPVGSVLQRLACLGPKHGVSIVANWGDRFPCAESNRSVAACPSDGHWQYNTEIAVDHAGTLLAKYHKLHTFNATEFDSPPLAEAPVAFDLPSPRTGAYLQTVGLLVCFDTMFPSPGLEMLKPPSRLPNGQRVTTFTVSHWWVDQNAFMNAVTYFEALSRAWGVNLLAAASVWPKIFPWGSGSGIFTRGHVLGSIYRSRERNVSVGNDLSVVATVPVVSVGDSHAAALPPVVPPPVRHVPPLPVCQNFLRFDAADFYADDGRGAPAWVNRSLQCLNFTCNVSALAGPRRGSTIANTTGGGLQSGMYWFLYMDWGYYHMGDGNGVRYFEQFCSLFQCPHAAGCTTHQEQIADDHGSSQWQRIEVAASLEVGAVVFPMVSGGDGNVYRHVMRDVSVRPVFPNDTVTNYPVVVDGRGTAAVLAPSSSSPVTGAAQQAAGLINLSVLGRLYAADIQVVNTSGHTPAPAAVAAPQRGAL